MQDSLMLTLASPITRDRIQRRENYSMIFKGFEILKKREFRR
jgi:hypothetical protein